MSDDKNVFPAPYKGQGQAADSENVYETVPEMPVEKPKTEVKGTSASPYEHENPYKKTSEFFEQISSPNPFPKESIQFPKVDTSSFRKVSDTASEYVPQGESDVPDMPAERFPVPSFLAENKSYSGEDGATQEIPPMPQEETQVEIPAMPVGVPVDEDGVPAPVEKKKKNTKADELDEKLGEALNNTTRWFKRRKNLLVSLISTLVIIALVLFALFKLTLSYTSDLMVRKAVNKVNPSIAYFVIQDMSDTNIRLTGLVNKNGVLIAKEVNITYNLPEFVLDKKIRRIEASGMDIVVNAKENTFSVPLLDGWKASGSDSARPEYTVNSIDIQNSKISLYGYVNGVAKFSATGSLQGVLNLSVPLTISSDKFNGTANAELNGWAGNFDVVLKSKEMNYISEDSYESDISLNFNLKTKEWMLHNAKIDYSQQLGRYSITADADVEYEAGMLDADLALKTSISAAENVNGADEASSYTEASNQEIVPRNSRRYLRARMAAAMAENEAENGIVNSVVPVPDELLDNLPIGEVKIRSKNARLKLENGFSAYMPLELSVDSGQWEDLNLDKVKAKLDGNLECKKGKCSYYLSDNASLFVSGLKTPAFSSKLEMTDSLDIKLLKNPKPVFELSLDNLSFNATFDHVDIYGSVAGVTKPNVFTVNTGKASVSGSLNIDGKYSVSTYLGGFNYSDTYYRVKNGYMHSVISSAAPVEMHLKASYFEMKEGMFDIAPMAFELEAVPEGAMHKFKAAWKDKKKNFSLYIRGLYDSVRDRGTARFVLQPLTVGSDNKLEDLFPAVKRYVTDVRGQVAAEGTLNWMYSYVTGPVKLDLKNVSFKKGYLDVKGLNTTFSLTNINPPVTVRGQSLSAASVTAMFPFKDVKMNLAIAENGSLTISDASASLFGGKVATLGNWLISDNVNVSPYLLLVKSGKLQEVAKYLKLPVDMEGTFDARLPLLVTDKNVSVSLGDLKSIGDGYIRYNGSGNSRAARVLSALNYKNIAANLDISLLGDTRVRMMVEGLNPAVNGENKFTERLELEGKTGNILK